MASFGSLGTLSARVALDTTPLSAGMKTAGLAFAAVAAGAAAAIYKVGSDYEQSLNTFRAVSGASAEQMKMVGTTARQLGADMSLPATSAGDAAKAMTELAKAGLSVDEALSAAKGTLQLAAAAQVSEAEAAEITANALNAFGLKGSEAGRVADILAASANASSAEITDMADALKMSSAVFASANIPIEDLSAALGELANKGIKGSDAGTSLKQMMLSLEGPSKISAGVMKELGLSIYDSNGKMVSFREIIRRTGESMKGLTEEQRNAALAQIFGSDAVRAANIVLLGGVDAFDKMKEAVTRQGAAADVSAAKTQGLKGAFEGLKSQLETVAIDLYTKVSPAIEGTVRQLAERVPQAVSAVTSAFRDMRSGFQEGLVDDGIFNRLGDAARRIADFIQENWPRVRETLLNFVSVVKPLLDGMFTGIETAGPIALAAVGAIALAIEKFGQLLSDNKPVVEAMAAIITTVLIPALTLAAIEAMASAVTQAAAWVVAHVQAVISAAIHVVQAAIVVGTWILMGVTAMVQAAIIAAAWLISMGPIALVVLAVIGLAAIFVKNWDTIKDVVMSGVAFVVDRFLTMVEWVTRAAAAAFGWVPGVGDKLRAAAREVEEFRDDVNAYLSGIRDRTINVNFRVDQSELASIQGAAGVARQPVYAFAEGGLVDSPTFGLIGEAGRELILPLTNMRRTFQLLAQAGLVKPFSMPGNMTRPPAAAAPMAAGGSSGASVVQHIYPSARMDERDLAAVAAREMAWAATR